MGPRVPWIIPDGHRMEEEPTVVSSYAGLCPQGISAHKMGAGHLRVTAETEPTLRAALKLREPQAEHLREVSELYEDRFKDVLDVLFSSPLCVAYT